MFETLIAELPANAAIVGALMLVLWVVSVIRVDASIVDPWWSMAFLFVAGRTAVGQPLTPARVLLLGLVVVWAVRLWAFLLVRNAGRGEDPRYRAFRERFGPERYWWVSLFQVFGLQGLLVLIIASPLVVAFAAPGVGPIGPWSVLGAVLVLVGLGFEAVGDWQLARWKASAPERGAVFDRGLWRYTRHPNYFGEAVLWWGFWLSSLPAPEGVATVFAPVLMTYLLLRVSGVSLLEDGMRRTKPAYADYVDRTSAFFPWPPRAASRGDLK